MARYLPPESTSPSICFSASTFRKQRSLKKPLWVSNRNWKRFIITLSCAHYANCESDYSWSMFESVLPSLLHPFVDKWLKFLLGTDLVISNRFNCAHKLQWIESFVVSAKLSSESYLNSMHSWVSHITRCAFSANSFVDARSFWYIFDV